MNFDNYLFRCSSLGKLMVGLKPTLTPNQEKELVRLQDLQSQGKITEKQTATLGDLLTRKNAKQELSVTTQNFLKELHKEVVFGRSKHLTNKYVEKGLTVEEFSFTLYTSSENKFLQKNKIRYTNEFLTGEPDNTQGIIRDMKSSWDFSTFPFHDTELTNKDYYWQMQGYMDLTGLKSAEIVYCLVDTPIKQIEDELRRLDWKVSIYDSNGDVKEEHIPLVVETVSNLLYTQNALKTFCNHSSSVYYEWFENFKEVPKELRIKIFEIQKNDDDILLLHNQIKRCRAYMNDLHQSIFNHSKAS